MRHILLSLLKVLCKGGWHNFWGQGGVLHATAALTQQSITS